MKEQHIECGDMQYMNSCLAKAGVRETSGRVHDIGSFFGITIVQNDSIPKDEAHLIDRNGKVLQIYKL